MEGCHPINKETRIVVWNTYTATARKERPVHLSTVISQLIHSNPIWSYSCKRISLWISPGTHSPIPTTLRNGGFLLLYYLRNTSSYLHRSEIVVVAKDEEEAVWVGMEICNSQDFTLVDVEPVKMTKDSYYPNKWQAVKDIDEISDDLPFDEFFEWRVMSKILPGTIPSEWKIKRMKITEKC